MLVDFLIYDENHAKFIFMLYIIILYNIINLFKIAIVEKDAKLQDIGYKNY